MNQGDQAQYRQRVVAWQLAEPEVDAMRWEEIRASTRDGIRAVIPTAEMLHRLGVEISPDTGLVEQQAWFAKLRHG
jgi:hypothetical protein